MYSILHVTTIVLLAAIHAAGQATDGFTLVKQDGDVSVYERWITYPANSDVKAREVKGVFYFDNTVYAGLALLQDDKKIYQWQSHVSEFKVYKQDNAATWHEYSYHDIPWPVSDQDHFLEYTLVEKQPARLLYVSFRSKENTTLAPVRRGVTRMELQGSWTFEQITPTKTKVTYVILSKPIGIPKFLTDPIIRSNIMSTIDAYVGLLAKK